MRLYLLDLPEGSATRILAIAIVAPEARFDAFIEATTPLLLKQTPISEEQLVRLYLVDLPGGSARVLAIAIIHADVDGALELAAPIVDSIEFHAR